MSHANSYPYGAAPNHRARMYDRIRQHGENLLAIFPDATERDPVKLCKELRRIESRGQRHALAMCNDADYCRDNYRHSEAIAAGILRRVHALLASSRPWLNQDPRGYALKIDLEPGERLHQDWGGYGILAPDLTEE